MSPPKHSLEDALEALDSNLDAARRDAQRRRLRAALPARRAWVVGFGSFALASAVALLVGFIVLQGRPDSEGKVIVSAPAAPVPPVTQQASASGASEHEAVKAARDDDMPNTPSLRRVSLGRGAVMALAEDAKARGRRVGPRTFEVQLEEGKVELGDDSKAHTVTRAAWVVLAGEYRVKAKDAVFSVSYEAASRAVHVQVAEGQVLVSGPGTTSKKITAGEELHASQTLRSTSGRSQQTQRGRNLAQVEPSPDWRALYQAGRYAEALTLAKQSGLIAAKDSLSATDLTDLAGAARLARASGEAQTLLNTLRAHYPDSRGARDAAFLLGRLASDRGLTTEAQSWFTTYLRESPSGAYAQESLGRLLTLASQASDSARTSELAARYLSKFPGGPYAALARSLSR